jgi:hypothetical protein
MSLFDSAFLAEEIGRALGTKRIPAVLGDVNGNIYDADRMGYVWVQQSTDSGITQTLSVKMYGTVRMNPGMAVLLSYDHHGELCVIGQDFEGMVASGQNPIVNNPLDRYANSYINQEQIQTLICHAFGTTDAPSMLVVVRAWLVRRGTLWTYLTEQQLDLTSYVPSSGNHLLAAVWVTAANTIAVTTSTAQATTTPFDITDLQECQTGINGQSTPVRFWRLYGGQTGVVETDSWLDGRQFLYAPAAETDAARHLFTYRNFGGL